MKVKQSGGIGRLMGTIAKVFTRQAIILFSLVVSSPGGTRRQLQRSFFLPLRTQLILIVAMQWKLNREVG